MSTKTNTKQAEDLQAAHQLGFAAQCMGTNDAMSTQDVSDMYSSARSYADRNVSVAETLVEQASLLRPSN